MLAILLPSHRFDSNSFHILKSYTTKFRLLYYAVPTPRVS